MPKVEVENRSAEMLMSSPIGELPPRETIFGRSACMRSVAQRVEKVARANVPVLIHGESGTGKEVIAKFIHNCSPWNQGPFVKVNCAAIPGTLLESELFGYERGAFTGACGSKPGRVEMAHRGTLFLDEIAELPPALQAKLLQVLQDGQFCRIGAQADKRVEARVVCATNRNLELEMEAGTFRRDLFYRINVVKVSLPPLREREEDIPVLVQYLLDCYNRKYNFQAPPLSAGLLRLMQRHAWPGNIREMENLIKRYVILGGEDAISSELVSRGETAPKSPLPAEGSIPLKKVVWQVGQEVERKIILKALQDNHWNRKRVARALNISYRALLYKIRNAGLPSKRLLAANPENGSPATPPAQDELQKQGNRSGAPALGKRGPGRPGCTMEQMQ